LFVSFVSFVGLPLPLQLYGVVARRARETTAAKARTAGGGVTPLEGASKSNVYKARLVICSALFRSPMRCRMVDVAVDTFSLGRSRCSNQTN